MRNRVRTLTPALRALIADQAATAPHTLALVKPKRARVPAPVIEPASSAGLSPAWVALTVPFRLDNRTKRRGHTAQTSGADRRMWKVLEPMLAVYVPEPVRLALAGGCVVRLTRISPGRLDEHDSLPVAFKTVVDRLARWMLGGRMGEMDSDPRLTWKYGQRADGKAHGFTVQMWEGSRP